MKLLVTGGSGFVGSQVIQSAIARGYRIVNLDLVDIQCRTGDRFVPKEGSAYTFERADVRDRPGIDQILVEHAPDAVMHLGSTPINSCVIV